MRLTVRHLMNHRSGLRDPAKLRGIIRQNFTPAEVMEALESEPIASKPGEVYAYTTANYAILGLVIERVTGKTYAQVVKQSVYDPRG
ncbi:MAG TPA: serine hydrolase domain-containing protein [Thermoanaerobaculia bacterium]|nr:serine hydrolase domain-containing protein [Thermoanaerobaculia bacterium]